MAVFWSKGRGSGGFIFACSQRAPCLPAGHRFPGDLGWHLHPSPARSDSLTQEASTLKSRFPSFSFNFHYVNFAFPGIEILNGWAHLEIKVSKDLIYINGDASLTCREAETRMDGSNSG